MGLTRHEAEIVKDGWEIVLMPIYESLAMEFFLKMFEKDQSIKEKFLHLVGDNIDLTVEELQQNEALQKHANIALLLVGDAVSNLGCPEAAEKVKKRLRLLGSLHTRYNALEEYFGVVEEALMEVLAKAFRSLWCGELEKAWRRSFDIVVDEMTTGLRDGYEKMQAAG